jgi:hypothetical protein
VLIVVGGIKGMRGVDEGWGFNEEREDGLEECSIF